MSNGVFQEGDGRVLAFIGVDRHEADARVIVDVDMSELPSGSLGGVVSVACHAMAWSNDTAELLGIDMQLLARCSPFIHSLVTSKRH